VSLPAAVPPVVALEPLLVAAGEADVLELSPLLPPHAASPMPRARLQAPARIKRLVRFNGGLLYLA
jgi:hypothetical protein